MDFAVLYFMFSILWTNSNETNEMSTIKDLTKKSTTDSAKSTYSHCIVLKPSVWNENEKSGSQNRSFQFSSTEDRYAVPKIFRFVLLKKWLVHIGSSNFIRIDSQNLLGKRWNEWGNLISYAKNYCLMAMKKGKLQLLYMLNMLIFLEMWKMSVIKCCTCIILRCENTNLRGTIHLMKDKNHLW